MARQSSSITTVSLTRSDGQRKDNMLEQTDHQNQNSSVWQKELYLASLHNAAKQRAGLIQQLLAKVSCS